tara:strand:+ start:2127 stop:2597 length:471 start_codon:yes stop_codon:yes gene_type:complete
MMKTLKKILFVILIFNLFQNCGYKPLLTDQNQKFSIANINIYGDKKLSRTLGNYFNEIEGVDNNLILEIRASKQKVISNKTSIGATSEYTVTINFEIQVISELSKNVIFSENFSRSSSFKASKVHLDTLNRENKIVDNNTKDIADEITKRLNVIFN